MDSWRIDRSSVELVQPPLLSQFFGVADQGNVFGFGPSAGTYGKAAGAVDGAAAGNTGMEPGKTSFFQARGVPPKIARGTIEITTDLKSVEAGAKVGASEAPRDNSEAGKHEKGVQRRQIIWTTTLKEALRQYMSGPKMTYKDMSSKFGLDHDVQVSCRALEMMVQRGRKAGWLPQSAGPQKKKAVRKLNASTPSQARDEA